MKQTVNEKKMSNRYALEAHSSLAFDVLVTREMIKLTNTGDYVIRWQMKSNERNEKRDNMRCKRPN